MKLLFLAKVGVASSSLVDNLGYLSGVTYCNINPESYLSNFRGQCYLFTLLFLCPLVRKEIPVGFDWSPVRHFSHPVEQVGEIFKEVDAMQPAGTCQ